MARLVILEGPDGAGKSTLGKRLAKDLQWPLVHTGGSATRSIELSNRMAWVAAQSVPRIMDRTPHISDAVYKRALEQPLLIPEAEVHSRLLELNPCVVYCRRRLLDDMFNAISEDKKAHKSDEYLAKVKRNHPFIVGEYDRAFNMLEVQGLQVLRYDWAEDDYQALKERILKCAG